MQPTRDEIVAQIRQLAGKASPLNAGQARRTNRSLHRAAIVAFGSWRAAVAAASSPPKGLPERTKWTPEAIQTALQELTERFGPLTSTILHQHARGLYAALIASHRTIRTALESLGFAHREPKHRWSRQLVIEAIQERHSQGKSVNSNRVYEEALDLYNAARLWLGSWQGALEAAGLDYDQFHERRRWTRPRVAKELGDWVNQHGTLSAAKLERTDLSLLHASRRYFDSLEAAARECKLPVERVCIDWSFEKIFEQIRILKRGGHSLARQEVQKLNPKLLAAVYNRDLTWEEAVESAGFKFDKYLKRRRWTRERMEYELRKWVAEKGELVAIELIKGDQALYEAVIRNFKSLSAAAAHFRLPHRQLRDHWSPERVVAGILSRLREGKSINSSEVRHEDGKLLGAAIEHHGSWSKAVQRAGIDYEKHLVRIKWTPERLSQELKRWVEQHGPLSNSRLVKTNNALLLALVRRYKTVGAAARALGVPIEPKRQAWTRELVLDGIRRLVAAAPDGQLTPKDLKRLDSALARAAFRRFGGMALAIEAAREGGSGAAEITLHPQPGT